MKIFITMRAQNEHTSFKLLWSYDKWHLHGDMEMLKTQVYLF